MSAILRSVQIPLFIKVETGSLKLIRKILDEHHLHFQKPLVLSEQRILEQGGKDVVDILGDPAIRLLKENSIAQARELADEIREKRNDLLISIGGGRILDTGKYAATLAQVNYISIPTTPTNDGICSPVAVLVNEEGKTESLPVNMPVGILVDTQLLTTSPLINIQAGIGDLISNFSSIADWKLAYADGKDRIDDFAASIAYSAAQLMYETGRGITIPLQEESFLEKLVHGLILSGIAMNIAGSSRPCSGSEHKISHAIDALFPGTAMHGIQVAFGTLLSYFIRKQPLDHLIEFFKSVGLPISHHELGLTDEQLVQVLMHAPQTRSERYTILEKLHYSEKEYRTIITDYNAYISTW